MPAGAVALIGWMPMVVLPASAPAGMVILRRLSTLAMLPPAAPMVAVTACRTVYRCP